MDDLNEAEKEIVKRGRNAENHHLPKNATVHEYMPSTAFRSIDWIFVFEQDKRMIDLKEILDKCLEIGAKFIKDKR